MSRSLVVLFTAFLAFQSSKDLQQSRPLSPSEELAASMLPFEQVRQQPDDLTDADRHALAVGREHAKQSCKALSAVDDQDPLKSDLLELGHLCLFGQQFELARKNLLKYMSLASVTKVDPARLMLSRAFLGAGDPINAAIQANQLLQAEPVSDDTYTLGMDIMNSVSLRQSDFTGNIKSLGTSLIENGLKLVNDAPDKRHNLSVSAIYGNTLRCIQVLKAGGVTVDPQVEQRAIALPKSSDVTSGLELDRMASALRDFQALGSSTPIKHLNGVEITKTGAKIPREFDLTQGSWLLLTSAVWTPSTSRIVSEMLSAAPKLHLMVLTSDFVNVGLGSSTVEQESELTAFAAKMPSQVKVVKLSTEQMKLLGADNMPYGTTISDGTVKMKTAIDGETAERLTLLSIGMIKPEPSLKPFGR